MTQKRMQFSVFAVAALAIVAVAAVVLLAGGASAQATAATVSPDVIDEGGPLRPMASSHYATPEPCPEEAGNANVLKEVVDSGHIALFDVYWNPDEKELTNNPCPPTVEHVPAGVNSNGAPTQPRDDRSASSINIEQTIIHIRDSAKIELSASNYPEVHYDELWAADRLADPGAATPEVWVLPACPDDSNLAADELCLSFSATLLDPADWTTATGSGDPTVEFLLDHVHQVDIDRQDQRYVLTYDVPASVPSSDQDPIWNTADLDDNKTAVVVGTYERPTWFFTSPGTYEFQTHVNGHPNQDKNRPDGHDPVSSETSVTGDVREYILHVGLLADLSVGVTAEPAGDGTLDSNSQCDGNDGNCDGNLDPGEKVEITVTAGNAGPDKGENTKVDVVLPVGLTHHSATTVTGSYDPNTGVWSVGDLEEDGTAILNIAATVNVGTRGHVQEITANIYATEHIQSTDVVELDRSLDNNVAHVTITPVAIPNDSPLFEVTGSIPENALAGSEVGDPISVRESDTNDTLTFGLEGDGADQFEVSEVDGSAQITVANAADFDHDANPSYDLTLTVSDGKDDFGNDDDEIDNRIGVRVDIGAFAWDLVTLTLAPDNANPTNSSEVTWTAQIGNLPDGYREILYHWSESFQETGSSYSPWDNFASTDDNTYGRIFADGTVKVRVRAQVQDADGDFHNVAWHWVHSEATWGP